MSTSYIDTKERRICRTAIYMIICGLAEMPNAHADPELEIAIKGGGNSATLAENNRASRYGFSGGFDGDLRWLLGHGFSLAGQVETLYTQRGADAIFNGELLGRSREHYFDVTITMRPSVRIGWASVYVLLGGGTNFLISASKEGTMGNSQDITGDLHRVDFALLGAAGVAFHLPRQTVGPFHLSTVFVEARHDIGLIDTDAVNGGFKNRTSSLMLGLSFILGGGPVSDASPMKSNGQPTQTEFGAAR